MKNIYNLQIDTSVMPTATTSRSFTVNGETGAKFILHIVQDGTLKYYNFIDSVFELGHNSKNNNLEVTMSNKNYYGSIEFPSGGGTYTIKLLASSDTEITGSNKHIISKSISKQTANAIITFKAVTANTANYATFPTTTTTGALGDQANFGFDWDITNESTDAGGFGLRLTGPYQEITEKYWYFTTTETVDGAISPSDSNGGFKVQVDDLTDIGIGSYISAVSAGSLTGTPHVNSIDTTTKTLTLSVAQTFADDITLTFIARGTKNIFSAIGSTITFTQYPEVTPTTLTQTTRTDSDGDLTTSTTITLKDTHGVAGGDLISYSGVGVDNSASNLITSVTPDPGGGDGDGLMVVELTQILRAGTVLTFNDVFKIINFTGSIKVNGYPSANKTIYLELDPFITVGAAS